MLIARRCEFTSKQSGELRVMSKQAGPEAAAWQIWMPGADRNYAAAHDRIYQTAAAAKTLSRPDGQKPAEAGELAGALVPMVPDQHQA